MVGLIKICVNMDEEKSREKQGKTKRKAEKNEEKRQGKKKKKNEREKSTDIGLVCGSHKQLKNIE